MEMQVRTTLEDPLRKMSMASLYYPCQGKTHGQRSLLGYGPWVIKKSGTWLEAIKHMPCLPLKAAESYKL